MKYPSIIIYDKAVVGSDFQPSSDIDKFANLIVLVDNENERFNILKHRFLSVYTKEGNLADLHMYLDVFITVFMKKGTDK